jgi:hypothetical protein
VIENKEGRAMKKRFGKTAALLLAGSLLVGNVGIGNSALVFAAETGQTDSVYAEVNTETPVEEKTETPVEKKAETPVEEQTNQQTEVTDGQAQEVTEEEPAAKIAMAETITVKFRFFAKGSDGTYGEVRSLSRTVKQGRSTSNISEKTANGYVTTKKISADNGTYVFNSTWKINDTTDISFPLALTYEDATEYAVDENTAEVKLYAQYDYHKDVKLTMNFTDIRSANGTVNTKTREQSIGWGNGSGFSKKTIESVTGLRAGQTFSYGGNQYTYNGDWTDDEGNKFDATNTIWFYNKEGESSANTFYVTEDVTLNLKPVWEVKMIQGLDYRYIDNISTGSGSWSNTDSASQRSQFQSLTHTFKNPEEGTPVSHYRFVYWKGDHHDVTSPEGETVTYQDEQTFGKGDTFTYTVDSSLPAGTVTSYYVYAWWQPSVTVNWYQPDGTLDNTTESFDNEVEAYSYTVENITYPDEESDDHVTFTFVGWTENGMNVAIDKAYEVPELTKDPVEQKVIDLNPKYERTKAVEVVWNDDDDSDGIRPENVDLQLYANGDAVGEPIVVNADESWTYTWENLDAYQDGNVINYTVEETDAPEGYEVEMEAGIASDTIIYTHVPEKAEETVVPTDEDNHPDPQEPNDPGTEDTDNTVTDDTDEPNPNTTPANQTTTMPTPEAPAVAPTTTPAVTPTAVTATANNTDTIEDTPTPLAAPESIEETPTPLAAPESIEDEPIPLATAEKNWALINLLATIATAATTVFLLIRLIGRRKEEQEAEENAAYANTAEEEEARRIRRKGMLRIVSLIPTVAAIIIFIVTEDMTARMQLVDRFTVLMIVILVIQIIIAALAKVKKDDADEEE